MDVNGNDISKNPIQVTYIKIENSDFYQMEIDGDIYKEVYKKVVRKEKRKTFSSLKELNTWLIQKEIEYGKKYVHFLLSRKDYFSDEIEEKLKKRNLYKTSIENLIQYIQEKKWLQDESILKRTIEKELKKGYGPHIIGRKILQKFREKETINTLLESEISIEKEIEMIFFILEKKRKIPKKAPTALEREAVRKFLYARGFRAHAIQTAITKMESDLF